MTQQLPDSDAVEVAARAYWLMVDEAGRGMRSGDATSEAILSFANVQCARRFSREDHLDLLKIMQRQSVSRDELFAWFRRVYSEPRGTDAR